MGVIIAHHPVGWSRIFLIIAGEGCQRTGFLKERLRTGTGYVSHILLAKVKSQHPSGFKEVGRGKTTL